MVEAMRDACQRVCSVPGCSASMASRRCTDGVEPEAECHLPAHAGEGGPLPWPEAWGEMGQETTRPLRGLHSHQPQGHGVAPPAPMDSGVDGAALQDQRMVGQKGSEVGPGTELLRDLSAREMVDLRRPVLVPADDVPHAVGVAGSEAVPAGRRQVGQQAVAPPGRLALQMAAVMLAGRTAMVLHRCPAADGEDCYGPSGPRTPLSQGTPRAAPRGPSPSWPRRWTSR